MAHSLSAKKRVRQNLKERARNRARKTGVRDQVKAFGAAIAAGDLTTAQAELVKTVRKLDKVAAKGTIHKNTASRKRSRLAKRLNVAKAAASAGAGTQAATA